ncbi:MAG: chloride channel protein [Clostridia bacterium]|nr:chloride channel protein [Clostridia bacterium]
MKSACFDKNKTDELRKKLFAALSWMVSSAVIGLLCGVIGAAFAKSVGFVTYLRESNSFLIWFLPLGGIVSAGIYKLTKTEGIGTDRVLETERGESSVPLVLLPVIFAASCITHLFGGSAGKEGAALQLGAAIARIVSRFSKADTRVLTACGMAGLFSAVFGTPVGACVFAAEVAIVGRLSVRSILPAFTSSIVAHVVSLALGVTPERFVMGLVPDFSVGVLCRAFSVAAVVGVMSFVFCNLLHGGERLFQKIFKNSFVRIAVGGCVLVALTIAFGTDYNGGGMVVIERIFDEYYVRPEAFLLKMLFTVITVAAGYKGGEIVPSFFIGASLGAVLSPLIGLPVGFGAALGMTAFFSGVTNCKLAAAVMSVELFGEKGFVFFFAASLVAKAVSGRISLYHKQIV